jgi:hypothetical protein
MRSPFAWLDKLSEVPNRCDSQVNRPLFMSIDSNSRNPSHAGEMPRRDFIKASGAAVAGAALAGTLATPRSGYCAESNDIKIALVGCGGRGTGAAANALTTRGPTKLWAMADVFEHRLNGSLNALSPKFTSQVFVPPERRFVGFDAFKHAIDTLDKGDVVLLRTYRNHGPVGFKARQPDESELAHQIANYSCFTWLNASFFVDWLIHNIDVCCWAKNAWPVTAQGHGARAAREDADQMFDQYMIEYTFADGTKLLAEGRHNTGCWDIYSDFAHGTRGSALIMESLAAARPRLYRNHVQTLENETWRYSGGPCEPYQVEHDLLFDAIRRDKRHNETERAARACMVSIMGRMAAESGNMIQYDEALASNLVLAPSLEQITSLDAPAPVQPDANGRYPIPVPGRAAVI